MRSKAENVFSLLVRQFYTRESSALGGGGQWCHLGWRQKPAKAHPLCEQSCSDTHEMEEIACLVLKVCRLRDLPEDSEMPINLRIFFLSL